MKKIIILVGVQLTVMISFTQAKINSNSSVHLKINRTIIDRKQNAARSC